MREDLEHSGVIGMHWGRHKVGVSINPSKVGSGLKNFAKGAGWKPESEKNFGRALNKINKQDMTTAQKHEANLKSLKSQGKDAIKKENARYDAITKNLYAQMDVASKGYSAAKKAEKRDAGKRFAEASFKNKLKWLATGDPKIPAAKKMIDTFGAVALSALILAV